MFLKYSLFLSIFSIITQMKNQKTTKYLLLHALIVDDVDSISTLEIDWTQMVQLMVVLYLSVINVLDRCQSFWTLLCHRQIFHFHKRDETANYKLKIDVSVRFLFLLHFRILWNYVHQEAIWKKWFIQNYRTISSLT